MARQLFLSSGSAIIESESAVRDDKSPEPSGETVRVVSAPSSVPIPFSKEQTGARRSSKSAPRKSPRQVTYGADFRRLCDNILDELRCIGPYLVDGEVSDEGGAVVAEIEMLLERLYACPYGDGEYLKRAVVAVQSQVNNSRWDKRHVAFLEDVFRFLRVRYLIDDAVIDTCFALMKTHDLDPFRGTICTPRVAKRYRIEEVMESDES